MPLHLLGKKSWNVYNADNIAKVKRDEAAAAAREETEEQRMQEFDAERRIQVLRGLRADAPPSTFTEQEQESRDGRDAPKRERKRRRIAGEDDTERDIRFAQEASASTPAKSELQIVTSKSNNAPLTDGKGHINLFPMDGSKRNAPKNAEAEAESARKKKEFEDQYTMRFSNAAGFKQAVGQKPWYHSVGAEGEGKESTSKDVWGNDDPRRKERERMRIAADDPLAAIQKGVTGLREVERERKRWKEEKEREMRELVESEKQRRRRRKRDDDEELNGFDLDAPARIVQSKQSDRSNEHTSQHRHRRLSQSRYGSRHRSHRHHHKSSSKETTSIDRHDHRRTKHEDPMAKLRKERDEREEAEHVRATALLARANANANIRPGWEKGSGGRYSAQFATT